MAPISEVRATPPFYEVIIQDMAPARNDADVTEFHERALLMQVLCARLLTLLHHMVAQHEILKAPEP